MERKNDDLVAAFARALKARRRQAGLSQEELAFRTDLSMSYISLLETRNRQPTLTVMAALAAELGLSLTGMAELIEGELRREG